jgi:type I restriction enzyme S subunit
MRSSANKYYLGDLVNFQNGYAFKSSEYANKGHNLIRIKNVQQGFIEMKDECFVIVPDEAKFKKFVLNNGDIVISLTGNVGRIAKIEKEHLPAVLNQRVATIAPKNDEVLDVEYLYFLLRTPEFLEFAINSGKGAAQQNVSTTDMEKFECYVPALEIQREIVEKLNMTFLELDSLSENLECNSDFIMEIEASLIANLWIKYANKLSLRPLVEIAEYKNGSAHEKIVDEFGDFVIVNSKFISSNGLKFKKSSVQLSPLRIGDVTMVLSDVPNGKALAKCFLVDKDETYTLNQRLCKLTSKILLPEFLLLNMNRNPYLLSFNNGENQTNLRLNDVLKTPIYVADIETQKQILDEYSESKKTIVGYSTVLARRKNSVISLRESLLSSIMSNVKSGAA